MHNVGMDSSYEVFNDLIKYLKVEVNFWMYYAGQNINNL